MKLRTRSRPVPALPGVTGPARHLRRSSASLDRLVAGDVLVVDHVDMDRATARRLVDAGVVAVLNAGPMISGRFPNQGPQVLVEAGLTVVDQLGADVFSRVPEGEPVRILDGSVLVGEQEVATGRDLDTGLVAEQLAEARQGMASQMESLTHNTMEFLRREQDLLLHDQGLPTLRTRWNDRPVVVVGAAHGWQGELRRIRAFTREQHPTVLAVSAVADELAGLLGRADVVVIGTGEADLPQARALRRARDVVALTDHGAAPAVTDHLERLGIRPLRFETDATAEDAALLLALGGGASAVVGVGLHTSLEDFLDRGRSGLASTFVTRLKAGATLVDAAVLPVLYDGAVRPRHLLGVLGAGALALAAAIGVTPVGQEWVADLGPALTAAIDNVRGILP